MSCYFCGGSRIASLHSAPDRDIQNWSVGSMTLARRYDGQPIIAVELDTDVALDISVNGSAVWAMLMNSYSRWRTTGDVFNETSD